MSAASGAVSGLFADRYEIDRALGEGATATVYLARDTRAGISVAIKMLRPELAGSGAAGRFGKEIKRTAGLSHPRILPVLDSGDHQGQLYVVLAYMEGGTLRDRLTKEKQLPVDEALAIIEPVAEALDYAHAQGLIHRDVKPENILFTSSQPVLGDFGIARALETVMGETMTSTGIVRGTPAYMSPEQASGSQDLDGRSDQYSLACVLYEMLAGVPAFMGPTPESIIAQRFTHAPREIRAYRPTISRALDAALAKALAMTPADRYRTASDFMAAVTAAAREGVAEPGSRRSRGLKLFGGGVVVAAAAAILWSSSGPGVPALDADTTRIVILPFEGGALPFAAEELMYEGLQRWQGLTIVETFAAKDAVRRRGGVNTMEDAYAIAGTVNAGRFVRGRVTARGPERLVYAALYDVTTRSELHHASVLVSDDARQSIATYAALADSLVLRGGRDGAPQVSSGGSTNLPAVQSMLRARAALAEWDLPAADSLFAKAVEYDPAFARAHLWLAQVRSWQSLNRSRWSANATMAATDTVVLGPVEREQAAGLHALAGQDYPRACDIYRRMTEARPADFMSWFGLGECQRGDRLVLADSRSPSGWRFRASYYRAMLAYRRAFELFPSSYQQFQRSAYEPLQILLYTSGTQLRIGMGTDSSQQFLARATAAADTIAFIPYPRETVLSGVLEPAGIQNARHLTRRMFRDVAMAWATALPRSAGTMEAVAVALEMLGDMAAARDSFRVARSLTSDQSQRLRLASAEVIADVKAVMGSAGTDLTSSLGLADSLLRATAPRSAAEAELLARLAIMTGRCARAAELMRLAVPSLSTPVLIPPTLAADAYADLPRIVIGCESPRRIPRVATALRSVGGSDQDRLVSEYTLIGSVVGMFPEETRDLVPRLARATGDYVLVAQDSLLRGDTVATRRLLRRQIDRRNSTGATGLLPDAGLTEARIWLAMGDTTTTIALLDRTLAEFAAAQPMPRAGARIMENAIMLASLGRSLSLRADLAAARRESPRVWATLLAQLWQSADPELMPVTRRMQQLSQQ